MLAFAKRRMTRADLNGGCWYTLGGKHRVLPQPRAARVQARQPARRSAPTPSRLKPTSTGMSVPLPRRKAKLPPWRRCGCWRCTWCAGTAAAAAATARRPTASRPSARARVRAARRSEAPAPRCGVRVGPARASAEEAPAGAVAALSLALRTTSAGDGVGGEDRSLLMIVDHPRPAPEVGAAQPTRWPQLTPCVAARRKARAPGPLRCAGEAQAAPAWLTRRDRDSPAKRSS
jgi:hypothetical protein